MNRIITGDCRGVMRRLVADGVKVNTVVTSPPYWGLRSYGTPPQVWGGDPACEHQWGEQLRLHKGGPHGNGVLLEGGLSVIDAQASCKDIDAGAFCVKCDAWRGELGLEPDYRLYIEHMREVFALVRDLLADDGTLWLNLGDCYATGAGAVGQAPGGGAQGDRWKSGHRGKHTAEQAGKASYRIAEVGPMTQPNRLPQPGLKPKDLAGIPWRVAFALQDMGWWLRQDNIWNKPNPMPESVRDRFTKAHEYVFLLSKSERYYFDQDAVKEKASPNSHPRMARAFAGYAPPGQGEHVGILAPRPNRKDLPEGQAKLAKFRDEQRRGGVNPKALAVPSGWDTGDGGHGGKAGRYPRSKQNESFSAAVTQVVEWRNRRSVMVVDEDEFAQFLRWKEERALDKQDVWQIPTSPYPGAHYATFPEELIEPCILAGSRPGDIVFDPFMGTGTVAKVAARFGRRYLGCDLDTKNEPLQADRLGGVTTGLALA